MRGNGLSDEVQIRYKKKTFFPGRVVRHWIDLPREVGELPALVVNRSLNVALEDVVQGDFCGSELTVRLDDFESLSQPQ